MFVWIEILKKNQRGNNYNQGSWKTSLLIQQAGKGKRVIKWGYLVDNTRAQRFILDYTRCISIL